MSPIRRILPLFRHFFGVLIAGTSFAALAAQPVTPPGSRIAMTPPPGFIVSKSFKGFERRDLSASVTMMEFPPGAYEETRRRIAGGAMAQNGVKTRPTAQLKNMTFKTFLIEGEQRANNVLLKKWILLLDATSFTGMVVVTAPKSAADHISEPVVRAALASLRINDTAVGDPHAMLPYIFDRENRFKYEKVLVGHAVLLKESPPPPEGRGDDAAMLITYKQQAVASQHHIKLGEFALSSFHALKVDAILNRKPVTVGGLTGHEYYATGKNPKTGEPLNIVMFMLFTADRYFVLMGFAPPPAFTRAMADIQAVVASFRVKS